MLSVEQNVDLSHEEAVKLSPEEFQEELRRLELQANNVVKVDELDRRASLIVSFLGSIIFSIAMAIVIKIVAY